MGSERPGPSISRAGLPPSLGILVHPYNPHFSCCPLPLNILGAFLNWVVANLSAFSDSYLHPVLSDSLTSRPVKVFQHRFLLPLGKLPGPFPSSSFYLPFLPHASHICRVETLGPPEVILFFFLVLVRTFEYVTGTAQSTLNPKGDFIVRARETAGPQEQTRTKKLNAASMVLPFVPLRVLASVSSPCRALPAPWSAYRVEKMASSNSLVYLLPGEGTISFFLSIPIPIPGKVFWPSWGQVATYNQESSVRF